MHNGMILAALLLALTPLGCKVVELPKTSFKAELKAPQHHADIPQPIAPQNFDYYLLNLSWSPEFCATHPTAIQCAQHPAFVLHGLWPQNTNGTYPQHCSNASGPSNPSQYTDIYPDPGLLYHEWQTHGTCSGLAPNDFFDLARQAVHAVAIPSELTSLDHQISMPPAQILSLFAKSNPSIPSESLALSCGNNYLTAVEVCLSKTLQPITCGTIHTCRANTVRIPPPRS
ncbi:MAG: ribonuclease T2 [Edaphobacter sp.]